MMTKQASSVNFACSFALQRMHRPWIHFYEQPALHWISKAFVYLNHEKNPFLDPAVRMWAKYFCTSGSLKSGLSKVRERHRIRDTKVPSWFQYHRF